MEKSNCFNCKTYFDQGSKLPLQGISVQLKNYTIPLRDQKHRWTILKTICSFLNSKGGTIFIGAQDQTGQIKGVTLQRKQQDDFRIFIQQLVYRIEPKVDLSDRQDILTQFVPVVNKGKFTGKYVIKIIVRQGQPKYLYSFSQKVQLHAPGEKKMDEFEIIYSYKRLNSGNIEQYKGYKLLEEVASRAGQPPQIFRTFHDNCNPQPLTLEYEILKLGFSNVRERQTRQILEQWFESYLTDLNIPDFIISQEQENSMIVIQMNTKQQFEKVEEFITKNIEDLNKNLEGICRFVKKEAFLDCLVYQNVSEAAKVEAAQVREEGDKKKKYIKKQKKIEKNQQSEQITEVQVKVQRISQDKDNKQKREQKSTKKEEKANLGEGQLSDRKKVQIPEEKERQKKLGRKYSLTFTHIQPKKKSQLKNFIQSLASKIQVKFQFYENTLEVFFRNEDEFNFMYEKVFVNDEKIQEFGFKNKIKYGINEGILQIQNYDKTKSKQLIGYLKNQIGPQLRHVQSSKNGNTYQIFLQLTKPGACLWLDKLLLDRQLKSFQIPGAEKGTKPKMKIYLFCDDPISDEVYFLQ